MVKWNNTDLRSKGIIVEKIPTISKGKKKIEIMQIDGRNGFLSIDTGVYEPFPINLECHCTDDANLDEIKAFLDGYGTLSFDNERQYTAVIDNSIPFETILPVFKKFQISFLVNPIAEDITATEETITESPTTLNIDTYADIYPTLEIACSGDVSISIGNDTFYLYSTDGTYTLDCKNKIIKDANDLNSSGLMNGDFPTLKSGVNDISYTGTITSFKISYRKSYL